MTSNSILVSSGYVLSARIGGLIARFAVIYLLSLKLGPEGYGLYTFLIMLLLISSLIGNLGFGYSSVYYLSKNGINPGIVLGNSIVLAILSGSTMGLLLQLSPLIFVNLFRDVLPEWLVILGVAVPILTLRRYIIDVTNGMQKYKLYFLSITAGWILNGLFVLGLFVLNQLTISTGIITFCVAQVLFLPLIIYLIIKESGEPLRLSFGEMKKQLRYGIPLYFRDTLNQINFKLVYIFIKGFLGSTSLGIYALAAQSVDALLHIPRTGFTVLFPKFSSHKGDKLLLLKRTLIRFVLLFALVLLISSLVFPLIVKLLYGQVYLGSIPVFYILLVGALFMGVTTVIESYLLGEEKQWITLSASFAATVVLVVLGLVLIPEYGLTVAAAVASSASVVYLSVTIFLAIRSGLTQSSSIKLQSIEDI